MKDSCANQNEKQDAKDPLSSSIARLEICESSADNKTNGKTVWTDVGEVNILDDDSSKNDNDSFKKHIEKRKKELPTSLVGILSSNDYAYRHSADGTDTNLLILLHGAGDTHKNFDKLACTMCLPQTACLSVSASAGGLFFQIPWGLGFTFFLEQDYYVTGDTLPSNHPVRVTSLKKGIQSLRRILKCLIQDGGWLAERIFILGFSCGACLAMETAYYNSSLQKGYSLGGIVSVRGGIKGNHHNFKKRKKENETPVLILVGSKDENYSILDAENSKKKYLNEKIVKVHVAKGVGHQMISNEKEMRIVMEFFADKLVKRMIGLEKSI